MVNRRLLLHSKLESLDSSLHVYFQQPSANNMGYPAIVYSLDDITNDFADNEVYKQARTYQLIVIDKNPDSPIIDIVSKLKTCKFDRQYDKDNLHHTVFTIVF